MRAIVYIALTVQAIALWGVWWGDVTIYLCGSWLQFNPGELSGVYTSPVWALACSLIREPWALKALGLTATLLAARAVMDAGSGLNQFLAILALAPWLMFGTMGFETSLAVYLTVATWQGKPWAAYLLPLVRPEGVIVSLFYGRWLSVVPFLVWTLAVFALSNGSSVESRISIAHFEWRYLAVPATWLVLETMKRYGRDGLILVCLVGGMSLNVIYKLTASEMGKGYTFDKITMREQAESANQVVPIGAVIESREIQVRRWLRPDLRVQSPEGLVNTRGVPMWRIASDRDPIDTVGWNRLKTWQVNTPGFVQYFALERR
jgi:hypothetical protein